MGNVNTILYGKFKTGKFNRKKGQIMNKRNHRFRKSAGFFVVPLMLVTASAAGGLDLSQPVVVHAKTAGELEQLAARELLRYLYLNAGQLGTLVSDELAPAQGKTTLVLLDVSGNNRLAVHVPSGSCVAWIFSRRIVTFRTCNRS